VIFIDILSKLNTLYKLKNIKIIYTLKIKEQRITYSEFEYQKYQKLLNKYNNITYKSYRFKLIDFKYVYISKYNLKRKKMFIKIYDEKLFMDYIEYINKYKIYKFDINLKIKYIIVYQNIDEIFNLTLKFIIKHI